MLKPVIGGEKGCLKIGSIYDIEKKTSQQYLWHNKKVNMVN